MGQLSEGVLPCLPHSLHRQTVILEYLDDLPPGLAFQAVITSNIPIGYGLGSSVALEVAMATFLEKICAMKHMSPVTRSLRCHKADAALGYKSRGISDHFATTLAVSGDLLLVDCQSKDYQVRPSLPQLRRPPSLTISWLDISTRIPRSHLQFLSLHNAKRSNQTIKANSQLKCALAVRWRARCKPSCQRSPP
jgi:galactokinase